MAKRKKPNGDSGVNFTPLPGMATQRELVVVAKPEAGLRATAEGRVAAVTRADVSPLSQLLEEQGARIEPLFGISETHLKFEAEARAAETGEEVQDLSVYYWVQAPDEQLDELAERLKEQDLIETAYVKPAAEPPIARPVPVEAMEAGSGLQEATERGAAGILEAQAATPDLVANQIYLNAAPAGVDARYAWTFPGGGGAGVNIIDLEWGWRFTHEDLMQNQGGVIAGSAISNDGAPGDHGTAVLGEISGDRNTFGVTGICPDARVMAVAFSMPTARAIRTAADALRPGDIMLLEIHRPGPQLNFQSRDDQRGYVAIEWWPDDYEAIRYAIHKGIIVVEAAGNGQENLDAPLYDTNPAAPFGPFPSWWCNPYRRNSLDSGAIVVGAGAPPPGTHGRNIHGPDRSRLDFSNYGAFVDAQGWGREVTTTGYGSLWRDPDNTGNRDRWYTDTFSGTSSASPIIVGVLGCIQGILRANGRVPLSPARARELLRATGSPQQDAPGNPPAQPARPRTQRIGNRPDLRQLIPLALQTGTWVGVQFSGNIPAGKTKRWFTRSWPAHWHVIWTVVPTSPKPGGPQIKWNVQVERASDALVTYWIGITNVSSDPVDIEARYAVLGW